MVHSPNYPKMGSQNGFDHCHMGCSHRLPSSCSRQTMLELPSSACDRRNRDFPSAAPPARGGDLCGRCLEGTYTLKQPPSIANPPSSSARYGFLVDFWRVHRVHPARCPDPRFWDNNPPSFPGSSFFRVFLGTSRGG